MGAHHPSLFKGDGGDGGHSLLVVVMVHGM